MEKEYTYKYPRPALTADCVIFGFDGAKLRILLIERGLQPYKGYWALPGGFMQMDETIEECAARELQEETGVSNVWLEQFHTFSSQFRDPRGRVVTVAFIALVRPDDYKLVAADDAANAMWFDTAMLPPLAFDHKEIVSMAKEHLRESLKLRPVAFQLLNEVFTLEDLRRVYEVINETTYDRRNFQKKVLQSNLLNEVITPPGTDLRICTNNDPNYDCCSESSPMMEARQKRGKSPKRFRYKNMNQDNEPRNGEDNDDEKSPGSLKDQFNW